MGWPAEWEPHEAVWIGFPGDPAEWPTGLSDTQKEVAAFANAVCDGGVGEQVLLVCRDDADANVAAQLVDRNVSIIVEPFGDIWLRDTGPIVTMNGGSRIANLFHFNGWGGKFDMMGDRDIGTRLAASNKLKIANHDWVLEGGAIEGDGKGSLLTTEQCVLNANRNEDLRKSEFDNRMRLALDVRQVVWLGDGLLNDHTDGHVDNLARFIAPDLVAVPRTDDPDDPNLAVYEDAAGRLERAGLNVVRLPSVGQYLLDGKIAPASYMNFYVGNSVVAVPQYEASNDSKALEDIREFFPDRKIAGLSSKALLQGGGSFHCISQQIPLVPEE